MKKITGLLLAILCAAVFCTAAFASDEVAPCRNSECPQCGHFSITIQKSGTTTATETLSCIHKSSGNDVWSVTYTTYQEHCGTCYYVSEPWYVETSRTLESCNGSW